MSLLPLVRIWLLISVLATTAGWLLSALGQLNRGGYLIFTAAASLIVFLTRKGTRLAQPHLSEQAEKPPGNAGLRKPGLNRAWQRLKRRFSRALPCCFLLLGVLVLLGGMLYPPSNHTALSYRIPRVLHWLTEGRWHWIHTNNYRMNNRACGIEWLSTPLLLFTKSDRGIFLLNFIPFLLLPGLIFSLFTRLGIRRRVAWHWMWLLPTGYTFLLQAGSAGNDAFPTVYGLAAVDFACRAWTSRRLSDFWYSMLAAALLVGAKASNLPLLLPWAILFVPLLPLARRRPVLTLIVVVAAVLVSFFPTAALNVFYCGDWSGLKFERAGMDVKDPVVGLWGNGLLLVLNNFVPPFFPLAGWWNQSALTLLPRFIAGPMVRNFEDGFHLIGEMPTEDWAGIGFGVSALALISVLATARCRPRNGGPDDTGHQERISRVVRRCVLIAPWLALTAYCLKSGMVTGARLITPYYPLLLPLLLSFPGHEELVRRRWWRVLSLAVILMAFSVLIVTPGRPLWPARTILSNLSTAHPHSRALARACDVYTVYAKRWDPLANVRALLPPELKAVGWIADGDDIVISLWRPFGSRRVEHFLIDDPPERFRQHHVQYVVINADLFPAKVLSDWMTRTGAELVASATATLRISTGVQEWRLVRIPES
jgi:hypothetical protein